MLSAVYTAPSSDISARNAWYFLSTAVVAGPAGLATGADMAPAGLASTGTGLTALHRHQDPIHYLMSSFAATFFSSP